MFLLFKKRYTYLSKHFEILRGWYVNIVIVAYKVSLMQDFPGCSDFYGPIMSSSSLCPAARQMKNEDICRRQTT